MIRLILIGEFEYDATPEAAEKRLKAMLILTELAKEYGINLVRPGPVATEDRTKLARLLYCARDMDPMRPVLLSIESSGHDAWTADIEGFGQTGPVDGRNPATGKLETFPPCPVVKIGIYGTKENQ